MIKMKPDVLIWVCLIPLFAVTVVLLCLNWNREIQNKLYGGLVTGTAVTLVFILASLKESTVEKSFTVSIVFDEEEHVPISVVPQRLTDPLHHRQARIAALSQPMQIIGRELKLLISKPDGYDQTMKFLGDLLQYKMVWDLAMVQRRGKGVAVSRTSGGITTEAWPPPQSVKTSDLDKIPGKKVLDLFSGNQFAKSNLEIQNWERGFLFSPKGTELLLDYSSKTGDEKHQVIMRKPLYYEIEFSITPIGSAPGLPPGFVLDKETATRCHTYHLLVSMKSKFDWVTSGSRKTQEYKSWAEWIFSEIEKV
ncbi:MAG: hypothetical protein HYZ88_00620 [Candidatus Omnitrophica bacterium]|nr:hypothetical protein [Candidatus Omnitrophota bacterium]